LQADPENEQLKTDVKEAKDKMDKAKRYVYVRIDESNGWSTWQLLLGAAELAAAICCVWVVSIGHLRGNTAFILLRAPGSDCSLVASSLCISCQG
jgi:hypothetical protein